MRDLIAEKHPAVSAKTALAAVKEAYAADATATTIYPYGLTNLECFDPSADPNPKSAWIGQKSGCEIKVHNLFMVYRANGMAEFYDAALATYNFVVNLPSPPRYRQTKQQATADTNEWLLNLWP